MRENTKKTKKSVKNYEKNDEIDNKLVESLKKDEKLKEDAEYRMHIISMATMFLEDFSDNIYKQKVAKKIVRDPLINFKNLING